MAASIPTTSNSEALFHSTPEHRANGATSRMRNHKATPLEGNVPQLPRNKRCSLCPAKVTSTTRNQNQCDSDGLPDRCALLQVEEACRHAGIFQGCESVAFHNCQITLSGRDYNRCDCGGLDTPQNLPFPVSAPSTPSQAPSHGRWHKQLERGKSINREDVNMFCVALS
ncbi:hypothetical protein BKA70DRAFT_1225090 [Coprinopsis sp. MPI-PUGE-AT-0042]|nr:hypothetical protein BKA70DRAFT_1225090 [Coprinopsis sp. MPI-PUGE-AT-0042]